MTLQNLLDKYGIKLQCQTNISPGWLPSIENLIKDLIAMGWDKDLNEIKCKFGGLRFYLNNGTLEMYERIAKTEKEVFKICYVCGAQPAGMIKASPFYVFCDRCEKRYKLLLKNNGIKELPEFFFPDRLS